VSNATQSAVAYLFKTVFATGLSDESMRLHPTLDGIPKTGGFGGDSFVYSVKYGNAQNIASSATGVSGLAAAQAVNSSSKGAKFTMTRVKKTGTISLDIEAMKAAMEKDGAFEDLVTEEVDGFVNEFSDRLGFDLFRDGTGARGQRLSASTNVITMVTPDDARNFKVGMVVLASPNADGSSPRTGTTTIANVDIDAGTVTLTSAAAITSFANSDYLFANPEVGNNLQGFELLTPLTTPTSTLFRGVDRTVAVALLSGSRINDSATLPEENAGKIAVKIRNNGGRADTLVLNPQKYWEMCRRIGAKIMYEGGGGEAAYGFEGVRITSPAGILKVISDPDCPVTRGRVFLNSAHEIKTLGEFVHIGNEDGNYELRLATDDALETRVRSMSNYWQKQPMNHGVFSVL
jgi:hypothetical protein